MALLVVGSGTSKNGVQLYQFEVTKEKEVKLSRLGDPVHTGNDQTFLCPTPDGRFVFVAAADGTISVLEFHGEQKARKLKLLKSEGVNAHGAGTCYLAVDKRQSYLLAANSDTSSVSTFRIDGGKRQHFVLTSSTLQFITASGFGHLGTLKNGHRSSSTVLAHDEYVRYVGKGSRAVSGRQEQSHPQSMVVDPWQAFVYVADLGMDTIAQYAFSTEKGLHADSVKFFDQPLGSGPRHIVFNASGDHMYMSTELSNEVVVFRRDRSKGIVNEKQRISTMPNAGMQRFDGNAVGDLAITPNGKYLYAAIRCTEVSGAGPTSEDTIAIFEIAPTGLLAVVGYQSSRGRTSKSLVIDASGEFLLVSNQDSQTIVPFRIDYEHSGTLVPAGDVVQHSKPTCLKFSYRAVMEIDAKAAA